MYHMPDAQGRGYLSASRRIPCSDGRRIAIAVFVAAPAPEGELPERPGDPRLQTRAPSLSLLAILPIHPFQHAALGDRLPNVMVTGTAAATASQRRHSSPGR